MIDLYRILGVAKDATPEEIKRRYYKLAQKLHPDVGGDGEEFKKVAFAYAILSDPEKRKRYDNGEDIKDVDNRASKLMTQLSELLIRNVSKADVKHTDIVQAMKNEIDAAVAEAEALKSKGDEALAKCREAQSRFGGEEAELARAILQNTLNGMQQKVEGILDEIKMLKEMYDRVGKFTYKVDKRPKGEKTTVATYDSIYNEIFRRGTL